MGYFSILLAILFCFAVVPGFVHSISDTDIPAEPFEPGSYSDSHLFLPALFLPSRNYPEEAYFYEIREYTGRASYRDAKYNDPIENRSLITPTEQQTLTAAIRNFTGKRISQDSIVSYRMLLDQLYSEDELHFFNTTEVRLLRVIEGTPREPEVIGAYYRFNPGGSIIQNVTSTIYLIPAGNVALESPMEVYRTRPEEMILTPIDSDLVPIVVTDISLGYSYFERPYFRGDYYEPIWIYRGVNRMGKPATIFMWASKDRGLHPPRDELDSAVVSQIIIHDGQETHVILKPGDPGFDTLELETKRVLHNLFGECPCYISPENRADQLENGYHVQAIFPDGADTVVALDPEGGPLGMIEEHWDSVIIPFRGPFGRDVYVLYHGDECNCTVWGLHVARDTKTLEQLVKEIIG
ncbi:MAG TPA: hypothetical protein HA263_02610 [Methanoregulaceae archaeon]|jgi:hypothetical protein|nr:hypothetical protein [Methanoregulaceae archaeon]